jgi:HK97 family phage major capsid protein
VPADASVGVGRALDTSESPFIQERVIAMTTENTVDVGAIEKQARDNELKRTAAIIATAEQFAGNATVQALASQAVRNGASLDDFRAQVMEKLAVAAPTPAIGMTAAEQRRYNVRGAILAAASGDWSKAGFEREASIAIAKRNGSDPANGGFFVPYEVQQRDMTSAGSSGSNYLVATDNLAGSFIDLLRARAVVAQLGATMLPGLVGNVTIPKQTAASTAYWLTNEATAITESQPTIGQLALTPKTVGAYTELSRLMLLQGTPAADRLVMDDFAKVLALAIDAAALTGPGSGGAPTGITATGSIGSVTGTSLAYAGMLEFQSDIAGNNALTTGCAYVTTPAVAALLAARVKFSSTASPLWDGSLIDANVCGFRGAATTQMTAAAMLFGDFSQVIIGEWGMLELAVSNSEGNNFKAGIVGVRAFQTVDVGVRNAGAFSLATSIT